jgi:hypothetical protein
MPKSALEAFAFFPLLYSPPSSGLHKLAQSSDAGYEAFTTCGMHLDQTTGGEYRKVRSKGKLKSLKEMCRQATNRTCFCGVSIVV